ncbi:hypothetical protein AGRA3207_005079 [Actinomadura graeca]|uniref:Uncharacterized protein n=1 Tax=Actinomadura graeca TaxID=2750812 RepID=A0ABX8QYK2_9ACTN|nr:hypothetical protein [Actinomadura graeca]QXJ23865.1 hypothetical protein AGRA3207_005079 [Actinomadura graeca]
MTKLRTSRRPATSAAATAVATGLAAMALTAAPPALAAQDTASTSTAGATSQETATHRHCVTDLDTRSTHCFTTEQQARSFTSAGHAAAETILAILYDKTGYQHPPSLTLVGDHGCTVSTSDVDYQVSDLATWSNRTSSFVTRNHCDLIGRDGKNFTGAGFGPSDHSADLGSWSNRISSLKLT